jgi:hypothetical protein
VNAENHERARALLASAHVEGISTDDDRWLSAHLAECAECSNEEAALAASIQSLRSFNVTASRNAVRRASLAVQHRAADLRREHDRAVSLWTAAATSAAWAAMTTPFAWSVFAWLGRMFDLPDLLWKLGFVMWWFLPATVLGGIVVWRRARQHDSISIWVTLEK